MTFTYRTYLWVKVIEIRNQIDSKLNDCLHMYQMCVYLALRRASTFSYATTFTYAIMELDYRYLNPDDLYLQNIPVGKGHRN